MTVQFVLLTRLSGRVMYRIQGYHDTTASFKIISGISIFMIIPQLSFGFIFQHALYHYGMQRV